MKLRYFIIISSLILVLGGYLYFNNYSHEEKRLDAESSNVSGKNNIQREVPLGTHEYKSSRYSFSILYPEKMTVKEFEESGGATTIVFENTDDVQGFQIYVVPYAESQISLDRIKQDILSGIIKDKKELEAGEGIMVTTFYSSDPHLGETREIWFVRNGFLFELTTIKLLESSLFNVLKTWQFN